MRRVKPWVFAACLIPLAMLVWRAFTGGLSANPIEFITHRTGDWTLRFLLITLAVTPVRRLFGWSSVAAFRRLFGLFAFFYALLHFSTYLVLDFFFAFDLILDDIVERRYVTAGFAGFVMLVPLAATSTNAMIRRLGGERWRRLHRLAYAAAIAGVLHYLWLARIDIRPPLAYAAVLALLLGVRLWFRFRPRPAAARPAATLQTAPTPSPGDDNLTRVSSITLKVSDVMEKGGKQTHLVCDRVDAMGQIHLQLGQLATDNPEEYVGRTLTLTWDDGESTFRTTRSNPPVRQRAPETREELEKKIAKLQSKLASMTK